MILSIYDVYGWNRIPMWPPGIHGTRPFGSANLLLETYKWLSRKYPWFNRTNGQNHIWLMPHDEGACSAPFQIWPGIILSHWGRMDFPHMSNTQVCERERDSISQLSSQYPPLPPHVNFHSMVQITTVATHCMRTFPAGGCGTAFTPTPALTRTRCFDLSPPHVCNA